MLPIPHFKHLDVTAYEKYYAGLEPGMGIRLYSKIITSFTKSLPTKIDFLSNCLRNDQNHDAIVMAHQLKGALLSIGGTNLADVFSKIEHEVNLTENSKLLQCLESNKSNLSELTEELQVWIEYLRSL